MLPSLLVMRKRVRLVAPLPRDSIRELQNEKDSGNWVPQEHFG